MNVDLNENDGSLLQELTFLFQNLFEIVTPEHLEFFQSFTGGVQVNYRNRDDWNFEALPNFEAITISKKSINIICAFCYSSISLYNKRIKGLKADGQTIEFKDDLMGERTMLTWVTDHMKSVGNKIDDGTHNLLDKLVNDSNKEEILEIIRYSIGFYLYHELGHIYYKNKYEDILTEELACDEFASNFFFSSCPANLLNNRARGAALSLILLNIRGVHTSNFKSPTHPHSYERLMSCLEKYIDKDNDVVWGMVVGILSIHLTEAKISQPTIEFENFYDCAIAYRDLLNKSQ